PVTYHFSPLLRGVDLPAASQRPYGDVDRKAKRTEQLLNHLQRTARFQSLVDLLMFGIVGRNVFDANAICACRLAINQGAAIRPWSADLHTQRDIHDVEPSARTEYDRARSQVARA